jgi:hypothetical protein
MSIFILTVYIAILCFAALVGLFRYNSLDKATRLLVWYICFTFLTEAAGTIMSVVYKRDNVFLYHIYSALQFSLISFYFNFSDERKTLNRSGWLIVIAGIVACILNSVFLQPLTELNTNFIVLESFLIIGMSLFAFYRLLISDELAVFSMPRFWFSSIFLVFWSFTFFYWLVGDTIHKMMPGKAIWLNLMIWFINIVTYSAIAGVFLSYKKMKPA